jgi:hypothetical protein
MVLLAFAAGGSSSERKRSRPIRAFSATPHDGQRRCRTLLKIPAESSPELLIPGAAAQTRLVSMAGIRHSNLSFESHSRLLRRPIEALARATPAELARSTAIRISVPFLGTSLSPRHLVAWASAPATRISTCAPASIRDHGPAARISPGPQESGYVEGENVACIPPR